MPAKPFLIVCILKTKQSIDMKLYMKGNFVCIKICENNSSLNLRFEIFMAFWVLKTFQDLREIGPRAIFHVQAQSVDLLCALVFLWDDRACPVMSPKPVICLV